MRSMEDLNPLSLKKLVLGLKCGFIRYLMLLCYFSVKLNFFCHFFLKDYSLLIVWQLFHNTLNILLLVLHYHMLAIVGCYFAWIHNDSRRYFCFVTYVINIQEPVTSKHVLGVAITNTALFFYPLCFLMVGLGGREAS